MSSELEQLKKQLEDYKSNASNDGDDGKNKINILEKMFSPRKPDETFRILDPKGKKPITEAFFHNVSLNTPEGKRHGKAVYCPKRNDPKIPKKDAQGEVILDQDGKPIMVPPPCPLCDKSDAYLKKQDNSLKGKKKEDLNDEELQIFNKNKELFKEAKKWEAKKYYIVKGIDKGNPKDGVKFWRFKHNFKGQGTLNKLLPALQNFISKYEKPFFDSKEGCDLDIVMVDTSAMINGKNVPYKTVSSIIPNPPSQLHDDPLMIKKWEDDPITWREVFKPKQAPNVNPYQFLELIAKGDDPYWDDTNPKNKHWVFPNNPELEEMANNRFKDLTGSERNTNFEQASDLNDINKSATEVTSGMNDLIGSDVDDKPMDETSTNTKNVESNDVPESPTSNTDDNGGDYDEIDDLPF